MKIAFFTLTPDAGMYNSLIELFKERGLEVTIITPTDKSRSSLSEKDGIRRLCFHIMPILNVGLIKKGIANLCFPFYCKKAVKKYLHKEKFDIILASTPTIAFYSGVSLLKKWNTKSFFYLILRDIYPDSTRFVGMHNIPVVWQLFRRMEKIIYKQADVIGCMSPANVDYILQRNSYLNKNRVVVLPNWEKNNKKAHYSEEIRKKYDLEGKFVLIYGGNMGIPQNLELLLKLAEEKKTYKDAVFLFVGKGTEKERLRSMAKDMELGNVRFLDFIPREDFDMLQASCNVGYITLHPNFPTPNIPSKYLGYYGAKLPILAAVDPVTDFGTYIIDSCKGGLWSFANDFKKLSSNFDTLYNNRELCKTMGENGYQYVLDFTPETTYSHLMEHYKRCTRNI